MKLKYSLKAKKIIVKLDKYLANRILDKMDWFFNKGDPLSYAKELTNFIYTTHRFRIWDFRVFWIFVKINDEFVVSDIVIRWQAYKNR